MVAANNEYDKRYVEYFTGIPNVLLLASHVIAPLDPVDGSETHYNYNYVRTACVRESDMDNRMSKAQSDA